MKYRFSVRLVLWYSSVLFIALAIFGFLFYYFVSRQLFFEQYSFLAEDAEQISEVLRLKDDQLDLVYLNSEVKEYNLSENGVFFEVRDSAPTLVLRSHNFPSSLQTPLPKLDKNEQLKLAEPNDFIYHLYGTPVNVFSTMDKHKLQFYIRTGQSVIYVDRILQEIRWLLIWLAPLVLIFAGFGGWYLTRRALNPIANISRRARDISLHDTHHRLPQPGSDDELGELVLTLNNMIDRIEQGVRHIQQFTADASHELRTPITAMKGEIEVALRRSRTNEAYLTVLNSSLQELNWMEKIVSDLFLLTRADAGELQLQRETLDLAVLSRECFQTHKYLAQKKKIDFQFADPGSPVFCSVNANRMRQVLCNLLDNAIKYSATGGKIRLIPEELENGIQITVTDNGIGIAPSDLDLVFNRFYRVDKSRSNEAYSSGLGLSICKWIVEAHGGQIEIQSQLKKGTSIRVFLPDEKIEKPHN